MNTVRTLMNGLFKRIIRNSHDKIEVIEPREYKSDRTVCYVIDHLDLWHYFVAIDYIDNPKAYKMAQKQHQYDECEAEWSINIPDSPADVSEIRYSIRLKQRFTKPRHPKIAKEV